MKNKNLYLLTLVAITLFSINGSFSQTYKIVDTGQDVFFANTVSISEPSEGAAFYGQDATYSGNQPSYTNNGDGTVTDNVTGLMWQQSADLNGDGLINVDDKLSWAEVVAAADTFSLGGYDDWRLPSIKEQYSLILFSGLDPSGYEGTSTDDLVPFIDTDFFEFGYGDQDAGERIIDAQFATTTIYVSTTMMGDETMFGVNFADGRIKGYGTGPLPGQTDPKQFYVLYVRGNPQYGVNDFTDNLNGTITDNATGLMWMQDDNGEGLLWEDALMYAEDFEFAGYDDWRLPNAKELQSIVDYTRSPATTSSAAINPMFSSSQITDEGDDINYPFYWSSTTHASWVTAAQGANAAYVCFGEALGWMEMPPESGNYTLLDVHGAGAQRSDPKTGDPGDYPYGHGPQGDVIRIFNYVRLVRDISTDIESQGALNDEMYIFPNPVDTHLNINLFNTGKNVDFSILNTSGQVVITGTLQNQEDNLINIEMLNAGVYFLSVTTTSGFYFDKFVKE